MKELIVGFILINTATMYSMIGYIFVVSMDNKKFYITIFVIICLAIINYILTRRNLWNKQ